MFIESIEHYGNEIGKSKYFWTDFQVTYPALYAVLYRAKVYRHSQDNLRLTPQFQRDYQAFWKEDTAGISENRDQLFAIQQKLLDIFGGTFNLCFDLW